jgi:hypothetical protein
VEGGDGERPQAAAGPLPCQDSNNSTEDFRKLATNHRKTAYALRRNVEAFVNHHSLERVGFLTLTFADNVKDAREAQRRFNSLATHVLNERYGQAWIRVLERQKSGRIHYHLLVALPHDIRTGANFEQFKERVYSSANRHLRAEWAFWRVTAPKYRFGRSEVLPVRSSREAIADYVGKYIAKHIGARQEADKGVRLVSYGKGVQGLSNGRFAWESPGGRNWRRKLAWLGQRLGYSAQDWQERIAQDFGPRWSFHLSAIITRIRFEDYPTGAEANADWPEAGFPAEATEVRFTAGHPKRFAQQSQADAVQAAFDLRSTWRGQGRGPGKQDRMSPIGDNQGDSEHDCSAWTVSPDDYATVDGGAEWHDQATHLIPSGKPTRSEHCQGGDSKRVRMSWIEHTLPDD